MQGYRFLRISSPPSPITRPYLLFIYCGFIFTISSATMYICGTYHNISKGNTIQMYITFPWLWSMKCKWHTYVHMAYGYFSSDTFTYLCYKAVNFIMFLPAKVYYCIPALVVWKCCLAYRYVCYAYLQYKASIILVLQLIYIQYGGPEPAVHFLLCNICIAHITSCHQNLSPLA